METVYAVEELVLKDPMPTKSPTEPRRWGAASRCFKVLLGYWVAAALSCAIALGASSAPATGRYLYVLNCEAQLDKLDTVTGRKVTSYDLAKRTPLVPKIVGSLDGCLAYQVRYDAATALFYTVVPKQVQSKADGTKDYRVLAFTVPLIRFAKQLPGGKDLAEPPLLDDLVRGPVVRPDSTRLAKLDVSTLAAENRQTQNQVLESSGDSFLLRLFTADPQELVLAVADTRAKRLTRLQAVPATTALKVHLAPGGGYVLVEESGTDRLAIFDAKTGLKVKEVTGAGVGAQYFLAIAPNGKAVYHSGDMFRFVNLGLRLPSVPVWPSTGMEVPGVFFADR